MRILVVEDDTDIAALIRTVLVEEQYEVDVAHDGDAGLALARGNTYDLIITDVMLPTLTGTELCAILRRDVNRTPILILSALASTQDIVAGLNLGADDYLTKPFDFTILLARVRALARMRSGQASSELHVGDLVLDTARMRVSRGGEVIRLTAKEFALLEYFMRNKGRILTREKITEKIWDMTSEPPSNIVATLIRSLRLKMDKTFPEHLLQTVRGEGYRLDDRYHG